MQRNITATFKCSNTDYRKCPIDGLPEFAFVGRSNVGKSSLINLLTGTSGLAKTSATPGKTQLINHFQVNDQWYLVDLPGYGYAKASKSDSEHWKKMVSNYLMNRKNLITTFVLIDSRLEPQFNDMQFMQWLGLNNLPFSIVFTKADKLTVSQKHNNRKKYEQEFLKTWETLPPVFMTSAEKRSGREELLDYIFSLIK